MEGEDADFMIVEPNVENHNVFKFIDYQIAYQQADIVAFLVAHDPFKNVGLRQKQSHFRLLRYF